MSSTAFAHARAALRPLITDDDDIAGFIIFLLDSGKGVFFTVETACGAFKLQFLHARDFHNRAVRRKRPCKPTTPPVGVMGFDTG